jgi:hypothetical protein
MAPGPSLERLNSLQYGNDPANWTSRNSLGSPGGPAQVDSDDDGVVDNWEYAYFTTLANQNFATADRDGDGQTDQVEYLAGTHPLASGQPLRLEVMPFGNGFRISHPTVMASGPGFYGRSRSYTLLGSPNLVPAVWSPVRTLPATGSPAAHDVIPSGEREHYRVEIVLP